jgi:large subunit ribosomal protein L30
MIAIIRISGQVGLKKAIAETLERLRLKRKYICVVFDKPNESQLGMIKTVRDFVAFGEITEDTYKKLVEARGKKDKEGNLKPFFRLHPARGGIKTKFHYPQGVLGENKKMDKLIGRML